MVYSPNNVFATQMCDKAGAEVRLQRHRRDATARCNDPPTVYYSCPTTRGDHYDTQPGDDLCELHLPCTLRSLDESGATGCESASRTS